MRALTILCLTFFTLGLPAQELFVWPGDTNNDSIVNTRDLLPVGIAFGSEVIERDDMTQTWDPKFTFGLPGQELPNTGVNFAHGNSNGDFLIDTLDIDAIALNYDSTIIAGAVIPYSDQWTPPPFAFVTYCPSLRIEFEEDFALEGDTVEAGIFLDFLPDTPAPPADGILGLSFRIIYDPLNIQNALVEVTPQLDSTDLMYVTATANSTGAFRAIDEGLIDFGAAGRGENAITGSRKLGALKFVIVEDLIIRQDTVPFSVDFDLSSILMVNLAEERIPFFECLPAPVTIDLVTATPVGQPPGRNLFTVYPNPTGGRLRVESETPLREVELLTTDGRPLWRKPLPGLHTEQRIDLPELPAGLYLLRGIAAGQAFTRKIILRGRNE